MKIICIGRNYVDHIDELKNDIPKNPIIFFKPTICKIEGSDFKIPDFSSDIHHEIEIIYKISKSGKNIRISDSINYISGIGLGIDFTARDIQSKFKEKGLPWSISKSFDNSAAISKFKSLDEFKARPRGKAGAIRKQKIKEEIESRMEKLWNNYLGE